jgi:hypothetical protein
MNRAHILVHFITEKIVPFIEYTDAWDERPFHLRLGDVSTWLTLEELDALLYEAATAMHQYDKQKDEVSQ